MTLTPESFRMLRLHRPRVLAAGIFLLVLVPAPPPLAAQQAPQRVEILRGRVVSDSGMAVGGVDVVATMAPDRVERGTQTDSTGRFELRFPGGTGDYLVHVNGLGWQPWRKRVTRVGADSVLTVDVTLKAQALALAAVEVQAERKQPRPGDVGPARTETGAREDVVYGVNAAVPPGLAGDLNAQAATIPGVNAVAGGISVLGLGPSQNNMTVNGLAFGAGDVPREARSWTRVSSSTFDPSRGGFSGAQVALELARGYEFSNRKGHLTLDAPALQYGDPVSRRLGQQFTAFQGSVGGDGELVRDRYFYNVSGQLSRRMEDATTLLSAGADVLRPAGVAADSVAHFLQILSAAGVPTLAGALPGSRATTTGSFLGRLDYDADGPHTWAVTAYGRSNSADAPYSPLATPTRGGSSRALQGMLAGEYAQYFYKNYLTLTRSAFTYSAERGRPALRLPDGRVLVASSLDGGDGGIASLAFGGNGALDSDAKSWTWQTTSELQWYNRDSRHKFKIFAESRLDGYDRSGANNLLGSYSYASLGDLAANLPASYARVLSAPRAAGGEWSGVLSLGDQFRQKKLALLYGVRLEANRYTATPAANAAVLSTFGARTDVAPNTFHASPRLGFSYSLTGNDNGGIAMNGVATRMIVPRGVIRGGVGEFRSLLAPALLADAMTATGLPGATRRLLCVGPAVPVPDWSALAGGAAPADACADGSNAFVDASPAVRMVDPGYDAAHSWRANLGWSGTALGLGVTLDGMYSLNLGQPGVVDLNFAGTPRFTLGDEARPVFVSPSSIVASTGVVAPLEARRSAAFGRVLSQRSDLRGWGRQLTLTVSPGMSGINGRYFYSGAYTLAQSRSQWRGFDAAAFGDPAQRESAPGDYDIRHQLQLQGGYTFRRWVSFSVFGIVSSGRPFTPLVSGDVNGDGVGGDRAFIHDPAQTADAALASGMRALLAGAPANVRDCLQRQLGQPAARNSCRGPWTADVRAQIALRRPQRGFSPERVSASLNLTNPLGGLDQLLHGSGGLRGWGTPAYPDPVLYDVRGFDPATQRFRYEVNPRFGSTRPSANTLRLPFRVTLDVTLNLGKNIGRQQIERSLAPGHRMGVAELQRRYARNVIDIYRSVLEQSDSLLLSAQQTRALKEAQAAYRVRMDSLWANLSGYLVALPEHYDGAAALQRQESTIDEGWDITWKEAANLKTMLSPLQLRMVPRLVDVLINAKERPRIRMYTTGP